MRYVPSCALCRLWHDREITTTFYYEDDLVLIVDCEKCRVPMVVVKRHDVDATLAERQRINQIVHKRWPGAKLRCEPQAVKDHFHCHVILPK